MSVKLPCVVTETILKDTWYMNPYTCDDSNPKCLLSPSIYLIYARFSFPFNFSACIQPSALFSRRTTDCDGKNVKGDDSLDTDVSL